jgi:DNA topoisomerase-3
VTDHHALLPTDKSAASVRLDDDEQRLYDLVCRRLLQAWHGDHVWATTTVITAVETPANAKNAVDGVAVTDRFFTQGSAVISAGWKVLDVPSRRDKARRTPAPAALDSSSDDDDAADDSQELPQGLARGQRVRASDAEAEKKVTRPPKRLNDATLLTAMETAGQTLDDRELSEAMRDRGLGTPATRAQMIETLLTRGYAARDGRALLATPKGIDLIDRVHPDVKSPAMTGAWEQELRRIERGEGALGDFIARIEQYVREVVGRALAVPATSGASVPDRAEQGFGKSRATDPTALSRVSAGHTQAGRDLPRSEPAASIAPPRPARAPVGAEGLAQLLESTFGHPRFRPHQEEVCRAVTLGQDALLVMPTGAGKSLCYQLPGLARGGTCVVVSPLIALMEDQVAKLRALGLRAERIHSGRERAEGRAVIADYLNGQLDYLYIAPERLAVPGFTETLAKRTPSLIAIDEAHCISHWGHDFRPEYRRLHERLPLLRPAPVLALTATATPQVQDDIAVQLGLKKVRRFIHGFRRTNLAIEVTEVSKPERRAVVRALLSDKAHRPAILYAPSRKDAEALAEELQADFSCAAYHAGLPGATRDRVQTAFLSGKLEVVVATIAFGMGVDKADVRTVVHLALPRTLEGYYQEIGRAGRDGKPSRAVLLHSFVDRKTNEFLRERSYPAPEVLEQIFGKLSDAGEPRAQLQARQRRMDDEVFERALEKLWIHGGARIDPDETVRLGSEGWKASYEAQLAHQKEQEAQVVQFAQGRGCRMLALVRHFGDQADSGEKCGHCDACSPAACAVQSFRDPSAAERAGLLEIHRRLRDAGELAAGALFRASDLEASIDRRGFELVVSGLVRAGLVSARDDSFEKDGQRISFQRLSLTPMGDAASAAEVAKVQLPSPPESAASGRGRRKRGRGAKPRSAAARERSVGEPARKQRREADPDNAPAADSRLVEALRTWRLAEAKKKRIPAFRIMTDKALFALAAARPRDEEGLLEVQGVGAALARKHGKSLLALLRRPPR